MFKYYIFYKPFYVLSQFSKKDERLCLSDFIKIDKDCYPIGRLDYDSEGLLIITNDKYLHKIITSTKYKVKKTYLVQVEGLINDFAINELFNGVIIKVKNKNFKVKADSIIRLETIILPERRPSIRFRKNIPTSILEIVLTEGKNRQIRKMTAKVGFPTLRIIRTKINNLTLENLEAGDLLEVSQNTIYNKLNLPIL